MSGNEEIDVQALLARLERLKPASGDSALVFDGDGTLWSGDVAEDVFNYSVSRGLLRQEPEMELAATARAHGLADDGDANELAARIFTAYVDGRFPERSVCEVMTWCFAGFDLGELRALSDAALVASGLDGRTNGQLRGVFEWARREGVRVVLVSASPRFVVERAAARWDVDPRDIAASTPALEAGRVVARLAAPVPYAETKVSHARALIGASSWLASFGDSPFDLEMLRAAALGVAVRPKPTLLARLDEVPGAVVLHR